MRDKFLILMDALKVGNYTKTKMFLTRNINLNGTFITKIREKIYLEITLRIQIILLSKATILLTLSTPIPHKEKKLT